VLVRDLVAEYFRRHRPDPDPDSRPACAQVAGPVLAVAVKGKQAVPSAAVL
jgi:hypothetical protein